ncbi:centromere/kinetochore protein zw10 [Pelomyxa schiedti]|nr:centromere/kinetochore protein zw10 [Pelomyxa schiedti]
MTGNEAVMNSAVPGDIYQGFLGTKNEFLDFDPTKLAEILQGAEKKRDELEAHLAQLLPKVLQLPTEIDSTKAPTIATAAPSAQSTSTSSTNDSAAVDSSAVATSVTMGLVGQMEAEISRRKSMLVNVKSTSEKIASDSERLYTEVFAPNAGLASTIEILLSERETLIKKEAEKWAKLLNLINGLREVKAILRTVDQLTLKEDFLGAMSQLADASTKSQTILAGDYDFTQDDPPKVFILMKEEVTKKQSKICTHISAAIKTHIVASENSVLVNSNKTILFNVCDSIDKVGLTSELIPPICASIFTSLFAPLCAPMKEDLSPQVTTSKSNNFMCTSVSFISMPKITLQDYVCQTLACFTTLFGFFKHELNRSLFSQLSLFVWPKVQSSITANYMDPLADCGPAVELVGRALDTFERDFHCSNDTIQPASESLSDTLYALVNKRYPKENLQEFVAKVISEEKHVSVVVSDGLDIGFGENQSNLIDRLDKCNADPLPRFAVTQSVTLVIAKIHTVLGRIYNCSSSVVIVEQVKQCYSILDFYVAQFPVVHRSAFQSQRIPMLFSNSCFYLAHHMLLFPLLYPAKFPGVFDQSSELAPKFRAEGHRIFDEQVQLQQSGVQEDLKLEDGFANTDQEQQLNAVRLAFKKTVHRLGLLSKMWKDVLPTDNWRHAIGGLLDEALGIVIDGIFELDDIGDEETHNLGTAMSLLLPAAGLFDLDHRDPSEKPEKYAPLWGKYVKLAALLEMPLAKIAEEYSQGKLRDFTSRELSSLVRAIFLDSTTRKMFLSQLAAASSRS